MSVSTQCDLGAVELRKTGVPRTRLANTAPAILIQPLDSLCERCDVTKRDETHGVKAIGPSEVWGGFEFEATLQIVVGDWPSQFRQGEGGVWL